MALSKALLIGMVVAAVVLAVGYIYVTLPRVNNPPPSGETSFLVLENMRPQTPGMTADAETVDCGQWADETSYRLFMPASQRFASFSFDIKNKGVEDATNMSMNALNDNTGRYETLNVRADGQLTRYFSVPAGYIRHISVDFDTEGGSSTGAGTNFRFLLYANEPAYWCGGISLTKLSG